MTTFNSDVKIFVNGKLVSSPNAYPLPNEDTNLVFESLRSYHGVIFRLREHLKRLSESAHTIHLKLPKSILQLERELKNSLSESSQKEAFIRISVDEHNSYILVTARKRPEWIYEKGIDLKTAVMRKNIPNGVPSEVKTNAFLTNVLATLELNPSPYPLPQGERERVREIYEVILLDSNGFVTESTVWNLFMIKEGQMFTAQTGILHGVTRQFVIECARLEHLPVIESNLTRHDLWNAEEAFLTNTSGEIVPIRTLDGRRIGAKIPGDLTKRLMARFKKELNEEIHKTSLRGGRKAAEAI